ncbi:hypothetical protein [Hyalangium rubrum]|uniref:Uncharacterized protein n=1 Tax=Hyalangium rubrum TaxID=3103134 RepID=A0ABU5H1H9_9BACT|nr:hypothetical protein [Hyalangium sp. s54d21]MDY7227161.1 hypothetical protein [Hyalangium sp. s54d21]
MMLRYRVLKSRFDGAAFFSNWKAQVRQDERDLKQNAAFFFVISGSLAFIYAVPLSAGLRLLGVFDALISGTRHVESTELEGTEGELRQQLLAGKIKGTDLVWVDGGWRLFADTSLFSDTCDEVQRQSRWWTWLSWSLTMALGLGLVAFFVWLLFSIPRWLMSVD